MDNEQEYITITQVALELGWNKATVYDWIKTLGIQTHRFVRNRNTFLHITDVDRLKEIKEKPWTAGPNTARTARHKPEKAEKPPVPTPVQHAKPVAEKAQKRTYKSRETALPDGCMLATEFGLAHGVKRETFRDHYVRGLGPGLIHGPDVPEDGSVVVKDYVRTESRPKPGRDYETEYYLTADQQKGAIQFWERHNVDYSQCNDFGCWCHTLKQENE